MSKRVNGCAAIPCSHSLKRYREQGRRKLRTHCSFGVHVDGVKAGGGGDEQMGVPGPAKGNVGDDLGYQNSTQQNAVGVEALNAVRRGRPQIAMKIYADAVGNTGSNCGEDTRISKGDAIGYIKCVDSSRGSSIRIGAGIGNIKNRFV